MSVITESVHFIVDGAGNRVAVILNLEPYEQLREAMEELDDIRVFDEAKASRDEAIPLDQAIREIEQDRR